MTLLKNVNTLIFDLGGVLIDIDPKGCFERFLAIAPKEAELAFQKGLHHELLLAYEQGHIATEQFLDGLKTALKLTDFPKDTLMAIWNSMLVGIQPGKIRLLEKLRKTHTLLILSNTNALHRLGFDAIVAANFGVKQLSDFVHKAYYSYEMGLRKPDAAIYEYVLEDMQLDPGRTLFFDDNQENIQSARDCGIQASLITEEIGIEAWFSNQGLTIKRPSL
jgi:putative hydrolase of the HAD superfamily